MAKQDLSKVKEVKAFARYINVSPRKLRLVADLVRQTSVEQALEQLRFSSKNASKPLAKVINSAVANAVHNFNLNKDDLFVKTILIDQGPVFKRYAPRAQGRAFIERKRSSHISVVLEPRIRSAKHRRSIFSVRPATLTPEIKKTDIADQAGESSKITTEKQKPTQAPKSREKVKRNLVDLKRRLFNRRSGQ
jgi:large subunit ribosomal protein L22